MEYSQEYDRFKGLLTSLSMAVTNLRNRMQQANERIQRLKISTKEDFNVANNRQLIDQLSKISYIINSAEQLADKSNKEIKKLFDKFNDMKLEGYKSFTLPENARFKTAKLFDYNDSASYSNSIDRIVEYFNNNDIAKINEEIAEAIADYKQWTMPRIQDCVKTIAEMHRTYSEVDLFEGLLLSEEELSLALGVEPDDLFSSELTEQNEAGKEQNEQGESSQGKDNSKQPQPKQDVPDEEQPQPGA